MQKAPADNPLGILSIDHLQFSTAIQDEQIQKLFYELGFEQTWSLNEQCALYGQGQIRFLLKKDSDDYWKKHGDGVSKIAFWVENIDRALAHIQSLDKPLLRPLNRKNGHASFSIRGFGDVENEFVEREAHLFHPDFKKIEKDPKARPLRCRFSRIDHLTNNVPFGEIPKWVEFYSSVFGMKVTRYFNIKGMKSELQSEVVQLSNNQVIIPINAPTEEKSKSQIQEFLDLHKGAGVQHIALMSGDVLESVGELQERGLQFLSIPSTYYNNIEKRGLKVEEDLTLLEKRQLLVDGDEAGYLLQNFTSPYIGPLFFETIQRKKHWGFGEGNFQALFDSIEQDQQRRGYFDDV